MALAHWTKALAVAGALAGVTVACGAAFSAESGADSGGAGGSANDVADGSGGSNAGVMCQTETDCVVAANFADPCFSPSCSLPIGVSRSRAESDPCLVPWAQRFSYSAVPSGCSVSGNGVPCPESCAVPPACVEALCNARTCDVVVGYTDDECGSGGSTGSGGFGVGGSTGTGGTAGTSTDCAELNSMREALLEEALHCDLDSGISDCSGGITVPDACGCPKVVSDFFEASAQAQEAYNAWVNAGCQSEPCPGECFVAPTGSCQAYEDGARCDWGN